MTTNPPYLFVSRPEEEPYAVPLEENNSLFVGSGASCGVCLEGKNVEPIHCMFWMNEQGVIRVQDWNTKNGVIINGQHVRAETVLNSGDELEIDGNRIVTVLSTEVHQRVNSRAVSAELSSETTGHLSDVASSVLSEATEDTVIESGVNDSAFCDDHSVADDVEPESKSSQNDPTGYQYDVIAGLDELDEGDDDLATGFGMDAIGFDADVGLGESKNEEVELLRMEVEQLRYELAERDALLDSDPVPNRRSEAVSEDDDQTIQLVNRLEDLLQELQTSDDRVRGLEDMLRASDQATQAEREERQQLESWVAEIETRVAERESESDAELSRLKSRLGEAVSRHKQTQVHLKKVLQSNRNGQTETGSDDLLGQFREQIESLERQLESAMQENEQLRTRSADVEKEADSRKAFHEMEQKLLQQQVEASRERAEMARQRAELEQLKAELQEKLGTTKNTGNGDARLRAMRQHLREIHEEEKLEREEKRKRSLGGRISRLLSKSSQ